MKLPVMTAHHSLGAAQNIYSSTKDRTQTTNKVQIVPHVTIREDELTRRGWTCRAAGGGHGGHTCYSRGVYPHLTVTGIHRQVVAGNTPADNYYNLTFNQFHYSPDALNSYWYSEFAPGRWEPRGTIYPQQADTMASDFISNILNGSLYGYGAGALVGNGQNVIYA